MTTQAWILGLVAAFVLGACGSETGETTDTGSGQKDVDGSADVAEELALVHAESPIVDRRLIRRYALVLDRLDAKCRETRPRLAEFATYWAWQLDRQRGIKTKPLELLERVDESAVSSVGPRRCRHIFAAEARLAADEPGESP